MQKKQWSWIAPNTTLIDFILFCGSLYFLQQFFTSLIIQVPFLFSHYVSDLSQDHCLHSLSFSSSFHFYFLGKFCSWLENLSWCWIWMLHLFFLFWGAKCGENEGKIESWMERNRIYWCFFISFSDWKCGFCCSWFSMKRVSCCFCSCYNAFSAAAKQGSSLVLIFWFSFNFLLLFFNYKFGFYFGF